MKQYTVTVSLRGCPEEGTSTLVFSGYEAYQQWLLGRDIHGFAKLNGEGDAVEVIVPRHAISKIDLAITEAESTPVVDAFCGETSGGDLPGGESDDNPGGGLN